MKLIAISGKKRSGKNTIASQIKILSSQTVEEFSFAQDLKLELAQLLKVKVVDIEERKDLYRPLLQALGTFRRMNSGEDYWINKCFRCILKSNAEVCIVTDVRFKNEKAAVEAAGGTVIRMLREKNTYDTHESEVALDFEEFDIVVDNNLGLNELLNTTKKVCKRLGIKLK